VLPCRAASASGGHDAAGVEVIAFTAEQLAHETFVAAASAAVVGTGDQHEGASAAAAPQQAAANSSEEAPRYHVVSATNGHAHSGNGHSGSNGNANGNGSHSTGNGNGATAAATQAAAPDAAAAAPPTAAAAPTAAATAAAAAAAAPPPPVDHAALAELALAGWHASAAADALPGQQLSAATFDCGVSVTISRSDAPAGSQDGADVADDDAAAAPVSAYYVRVCLPADFGRDCVLHWGVENWELPPKAAQPPGSEEVRGLLCRACACRTDVLS
jgi:hypothetical protein